MDEEKKEEFMIRMEARMYAPLEWDSPAICKIQDLKEAQYEEALRLIKVQRGKPRDNTIKTIALNSSTAITNFDRASITFF